MGWARLSGQHSLTEYRLILPLRLDVFILGLLGQECLYDFHHQNVGMSNQPKLQGRKRGAIRAITILVFLSFLMFTLKFHKDKRFYAFYLTREAFFDTVIHSFGENVHGGNAGSRVTGKLSVTHSIEGGRW